MKLAKPCLDTGLYTNAVEAQLAFWQDEAGLPYEELLKAGGGVHQHRHGLNGAVLKVNAARDPLPQTPLAGYRQLRIARAGLAEPRSLRDPDGNPVELIPRGLDDVVGYEVILHARDLERHVDFYEHVLAFERIGDARFRAGDTIIGLHSDPEAADDAQMFGRAIAT